MTPGAEHRIRRRDALRYLIAAVASAAVLPVCSPAVLASAFAPAADRTESFLQLSSILTGEPKTALSTTLALEYIERLEREAPGVLDRLLALFQELVRQSGGDPQRLIALVQERIWQPGACRSATYGGAPLCDIEATPECCLARDIPLLWYAASLMEITDMEVPTTQFVYGSAASYLDALAWKVAGAHPQAQCGGTYGYWSVPPGQPHPTRG